MGEHREGSENTDKKVWEVLTNSIFGMMLMNGKTGIAFGGRQRKIESDKAKR